MAFHQPYLVIGFHSCDREVGLRILNGEDDLRPSVNSWDWLGPGIYFWEQNPTRALQYAEECAGGRQRFAGKIHVPFVLGAIIELGHCLNLVEPNSIDVVRKAHGELMTMLGSTGRILPINQDSNRVLDCAVFKYLHKANVDNLRQAYDTIRSPFHEGGELYKGANFSKRLHMEVCVRNVDCIRGYFLPRPLEMFNPYLSNRLIAD